MARVATRTDPESPGCAATDTHEIRTDLDESGQIWTNSDSRNVDSQPTAADLAVQGGIHAAHRLFWRRL